MRRFIPNFVEIVKDITNMLKKGAEIKWNVEEKHSFEEIKKALTQVPVLISPDFSKEFMIFTFSYENTIAGVLLQKGEQGNGLDESSNKSIVRIIKNVLQENKKSWNLKLKYALWAYRVCTKRSIGTSP